MRYFHTLFKILRNLLRSASESYHQRAWLLAVANDAKTKQMQTTHQLLWAQANLKWTEWKTVPQPDQLNPFPGSVMLWKALEHTHWATRPPVKAPLMPNNILTVTLEQYVYRFNLFQQKAAGHIFQQHHSVVRVQVLNCPASSPDWPPNSALHNNKQMTKRATNC